MSRGKRISFLLLCLSVGLAAFVCLDFYRRQKSPLFKRLESQWAADVRGLESSGKLPESWKQVKEIEVIGGTPETKAWLKRMQIPLKANPEGTNKMEVLVVVWEEAGKRGAMIQYNIEDIKTRNNLLEIGRTLILSTPTSESPMQTLLEGLKR